MNGTIEYYTNNSQNLCKKYDSIDLSIIHKDMLVFLNIAIHFWKSVKDQSSRDMNYLIEKSFDVIGIDGSKEMIREAHSNFLKMY